MLLALLTAWVLVAPTASASLGNGFNYSPFSGSTKSASHYYAVVGCGTTTAPSPTWNHSSGVGHLKAMANLTITPTTCPPVGPPASNSQSAYTFSNETVTIPVKFSSSGSWGLDPLVKFRWSVNQSVGKSGTCPHPLTGFAVVYTCIAEATSGLQVGFWLHDGTNNTDFEQYSYNVTTNDSMFEEQWGCTYFCVYSNATNHPTLHFTGQVTIAPSITTTWTLVPSHSYNYGMYVNAWAKGVLDVTNTTGWPTTHARATISLEGVNQWQLSYVFLG